MFITIKLKLTNELGVDADFMKQYANVVRYAYNRGIEGKSRTEVFGLFNGLNNLDKLDLSWKREAAKVGLSKALSTIALNKQAEENGKETRFSIFGGRKNFYDRLNGKITREEFLNRKKLFPITCEGSKSDYNGNRKFKFDINTMTGSVNMNKEKLTFSCHKTSKKNMKLLYSLYELVDKKETGVTYSITNTHFYITVELDKLPKEEDYKKRSDRIIGIDMNPNYIGLSILNKGNVLYTMCYDLSTLNTKQVHNNKRKYELTQIAIDIKKLCIKYNVSMVGIEKLKINSENKKNGKRFNKQVNNEWCREYFKNTLSKHMALIGCKIKEIVPEYSSFIGCIMYQSETDSIAASIEIGRRLKRFKRIYLDKIEPKGSIIYPKFSLDYLNRWKKDDNPLDGIDGWKCAYQWFKKSGHSYRLLYNDYVNRNHCGVFRLKSGKSRITFIEGGRYFSYFD